MGQIVRNQQLKLGHMLVYFASPNQVFYVDPQKINRGVGKAVYHSLEEIVPFYSESSKLRWRADLFDPTVFYVPLGPKLDRRMHRQKKIKIETSGKKDDDSKISSDSSTVTLPSEISFETQEDAEGPSGVNREMTDLGHSELTLNCGGPRHFEVTTDQGSTQVLCDLGVIRLGKESNEVMKKPQSLFN